MRQIILDTETTGLEVQRGHRVIEIGCIELLQRRPTGRSFHYYLNPDRAIDEGARAVTGISDEFLLDKPRFGEIASQFIEFVEDAEIIAHNAAFDIGFLDAELARAGFGERYLKSHAQILDTLGMAREKYPGQRNSLDALCRRLDVDNSHRGLHGALLDANLLADVYLALTAGQGHLGFEGESDSSVTHVSAFTVLHVAVRPRVLRAHDSERSLHAARIEAIDKISRGACVWKQLQVELD